ncbi:3-deoxy-7-phosphoheptulonate synthase [candidate division KSB1 bacterium]|nr:3-deoxy-7-phosphoheptulonate synthase [candidate division KSB1 bacterium]
MIIVMKNDASEAQIKAVADKLVDLGLKVHRSDGEARTIIGAIGDTSKVDDIVIKYMAGVLNVVRIIEPYKLASRNFHEDSSVVEIGDIRIGAEKVIIIAGPCAVESEDQVTEIAKLIKEAGASILRGGAFKPRSSPYSFQGLGEQGLKLLHAAGKQYELPVVSEILEASHIELMDQYVDIYQVGARNMQNFWLLRELSKIRKPVLLKRGMAATIEELLMAAEYLMSGGNYNVILCERGIRTFENYTRNTMDISAIPVVKKLSHLPIIADPSHGTGIRDHVAPMARAAVAAGADGLMIEVHNNPAAALSDGPQSLLPNQFKMLMEELKIISWAIGRSV